MESRPGRALGAPTSTPRSLPSAEADIHAAALYRRRAIGPAPILGLNFLRCCCLTGLLSKARRDIVAFCVSQNKNFLGSADFGRQQVDRAFQILGGHHELATCKVYLLGLAETLYGCQITTGLCLLE